MKLKNLILTGLIIILSVPCVFAQDGIKTGFRLKEGYRYDFREDNHALYMTRLSFVLDYISEKKSLFKIIPFFELRRNIEREEWERKEAGAEIGKDIFKWFYLSLGIQKVWMEEDYQYRQYYQKRDCVESEAKLYFSHDFFSTKSHPLKIFASDEYIYEFQESTVVRNELAAGFMVPVSKYMETEVNWRHIDRVHYYDSDTVEASVTVIF